MMAQRTEAFSEDAAESSTPMPKVNKSCDACRAVKTRCVTDPEGSPGACERCIRTGRACVYAPVTRRRPRQQTGARVAELERQVRAMRIMLQMKDGTATNSTDTISEVDEKEASHNSPSPNRSGPVAESQSPGQNLAPTASWAEDLDVVDRGLLTETKAEELVAAYIAYLGDWFPGATIPKDSTSASLRQEAPLLWLAVLAAAAQGFAPELAIALNQERARLLAHVLLVQGKKSLELVCAMHIALVYYYPPADLTMHTFFQYSGMACGLIVDLGLWSKPDSSGKSVGFFAPPVEASLDERCRLLLAGYAISSRYVYFVPLPSLLCSQSLNAVVSRSGHGGLTLFHIPRG